MEIDEALARIEALSRELDAADTKDARAARELAQALLAWHGAGLEKLAALIDRATLIDACRRDPQLSALMALHGMHPLSLEERAAEALERARAELRGLDADATIGGARDGVVTVRARGEGWAVRPGAARAIVERAIGEVAPELVDLEVDVEQIGARGVPVALRASRDGRALRAAPIDREAAACDLCGAPIAPSHPHVLDPRGAMACACTACAMLFDAREARGAGARRTVHRHARRVDDAAFDDATWSALSIPVGLAFFCRSGQADRVRAFYPGPAGRTECTQTGGAWEALSQASAVRALEPDVEALLVSRIDGMCGAWIVSIDHCHELAGRLREAWRGVTGGPNVRAAIDAFFAELADLASSSQRGGASQSSRTEAGL